MAYFPRIFRTGFTENIMLSTHGYPEPVKVTVNLLDTNRNTVFSSNNFTVQPGLKIYFYSLTRSSLRMPGAYLNNNN